MAEHHSEMDMWADEPTDPRLKKLAYKYLHSVIHRRYIEEETVNKIDPFLARILEIARSRRLAKRLGIKFADQNEIDLMLPYIAEQKVGKQFMLPGFSEHELPYSENT
jgi:hypothetical protein